MLVLQYGREGGYMREYLKKGIGLLMVGFILALGTLPGIVFFDLLPIKSATDFLGAVLVFTIIYAELGFAVEFLLPMAKEVQN